MKHYKRYVGWLLASMCWLVSCHNSTDLESTLEVLPEGMFPIEFTNVNGETTDNSQDSRITEDRSGVHSFWNEGDQVGLLVQGGGNDDFAIGTLSGDGNISHSALFWRTTQDATVTGYYPAQNGEISLKNQKQGFVYVMSTEPLTYNYQSGPITLEFKHQLAKVRIILTGGFSWLRFSELAIKGYTSCIGENGNYTPGKEIGYIEMRSIRSRQRIYEALVFPMEIPAGENALRISYWRYKKYFTLKKAVKLEAGHMYTLTLNANVFQD